MAINKGHGFQGLKASVVGLGIEGVDLARFLARRGAVVTASDIKPEAKLAPRLEALRGLEVRLSLGGHRAEDILDADIIFVSQSVPLKLPLLAEARRLGIPLSSMAKLFLEIFPGPVVGITGSSGKSTTTALLGAIFQAAERPHVVGGNIGVGLLSLLESATPATWAILEISHTQLELLDRSPHLACITNVAPNHLDHYTWDEYVALKARIVAFQGPEDAAVANCDDADSCALARRTAGSVFCFSGRGGIKGDGVFVEEGRLLWRGEGTKGWPMTPRSRPAISHARIGKEVSLLPLASIQLPGVHNRENVAAAACLASLCGIEAEPIAQAVAGFRGLPHRLELVGEMDGVRYYNDSIATTPQRALAGLRCFSDPLVLLLGGREKNLPLEELAREACRRCRAVVCFGEAGGLLAEVIEGATQELAADRGRLWGLPLLLRVDDLGQALKAARRAARPGDVVLLSPACASYDAYTDFEERGEHFRCLVQGMLADRL